MIGLLHPHHAKRGNVLVLALVLSACGSPEPASPDAGTSDAAVVPDAPDAGRRIAVASPVLTPCAPGWRETMDGDIAVCDPFPEGGPATCSDGQAHFPGEPGCTTIGSECPAGDFPEGLPAATPILYVRAGAIGGSGTMASPFGTIAAAMAAAPSVPAIVAIAKGTYDERLDMRDGITLWGACATATILTASKLLSNRDGVINFSAGAHGELRNLRIGGSPYEGITMLDGAASARIEGVIMAEIADAPFDVRDGSELDISGFVLRGSGAGGGIGLGVTNARVMMRRALIENVTAAGLMVFGPTGLVHIEDSIIRGPTGSRLWGGVGVMVQLEGKAELVRTVVEDAASTGVAVLHEGARLTLEDCVVRRSRGLAVLGQGEGLHADNLGVLIARRVLVDQNTGGGALAIQQGIMHLDDVVIRDTEAVLGSNMQGSGIITTLDSMVDARRIALLRNRETGALTSNAASLTAEDIIVRDTRERPGDGMFGGGLHAQLGAAIELHRAIVERSHGAGIGVYHEGSTGVLTDVEILDTSVYACAASSCPDENIAVGIGSFYGAHTRVEGFRVHGSDTCGVMVAGDASELDLIDGEITSAAIGACVQSDGYDLMRLSASVAYSDNGTNLQATTLPVPAAEASVPTL